MSIFSLPYISYRPLTVNIKFTNGEKKKKSPVIVSNSLESYLSMLKMRIEEHPKEWDIYKRYTNPFECIHTTITSGIKQPICRYRPISRSYFKMVEMLHSFNLLADMGDKMKSFHLAEGPGGFIEALCTQRDNLDDEYVGMTLISDDTTVPGWRKSKTFLNSHPNVKLEYGSDGTGDIFKRDNLMYCATKYGASMDLITADGGFDFSMDFNGQEAMITGLLVAQIAFATALQKHGGTFILKMFDIFSRASVEIVYLLSVMYEHVFITKPNTSRYANSERYIVCQGFRSHDGRKDWTIQFLDAYTRLDAHASSGTDELNVYSLLNVRIPLMFINKIEEHNAILGQQQVENITSTLNIIKNPKQEKIESLKRTNTQKCVYWCQKHQLPYNRDVRQLNMFLSAKSKNSRVRRVSDETEETSTNNKSDDDSTNSDTDVQVTTMIEYEKDGSVNCELSSVNSEGSSCEEEVSCDKS